jgi:hypothetical protein
LNWNWQLFQGPTFDEGDKINGVGCLQANIMAHPTLLEDFDGTVELNSIFIKQMKAEKTQMNVLEVNWSKNKQGGIIRESEVSLGFQIQTKEVCRMPLSMTAFMRSMSILLYSLIRRMPLVSNAWSVDIFITGNGGGQ